MAWDINHVVLIGNLVRDPELRYTGTQKPVCNFSIANNRGSSGDGNENANFFNIVTWDKTAEICSQYLAKGKRVAIQGRLQQRKFTDKNGQNRSVVEINANTVQFLGGKNSQNAPASSQTQPAANTNKGNDEDAGIDFPDFDDSDSGLSNEEVPF